MNSISPLSARSLAVCILLAVTGLAPACADDKASERMASNAALSVPQVLQKLDAAGYRHIDKIQLKRDNYEVRTTGRDGERIKLHVNAQTGSILGQRDTRKSGEHSGGMVQKLMGNCNERRCRDDLASAPDTAAPAKPVTPAKP
jgi:hypothetical protein